MPSLPAVGQIQIIWSMCLGIIIKVPVAFNINPSRYETQLPLILKEMVVGLDRLLESCRTKAIPDHP